MIQMQSMMDVADNTGAKVAYCIKVLGGTSRRTASLGDVVVVSIKKAIPGSGLGLAISQVIAEAHGGTLEVESVPGAGSTFRLTLRSPRTG